MARAVERRNLELFTPVGARRTAATGALIAFTSAIADGRDAEAGKVLDAIVPESHHESVAEVSAVLGLALALLDEWLTGQTQDAPPNLAASVRVPPGWKQQAKPAIEILALASRGRAFSSHGALIVRHGGQQALAGATVALAAAAQAWSRKRPQPLEGLLTKIVR